MSKIGLHCSFGHLKHKIWPKEGLGVKLPIWLPTRKSQESTQFTWLQRACNILLESSRQELQLCFRLHLNSRFARKVMGLQSRESPNWHDFGTPTRESRERTCPWLVLAPKVLQLCTNHFVWVVCRPVWVNEACQLFLVPSWSSNTPFYLSKCCELGNVPRFFPLLLSFT
jgi:hypothetical protein